MDLCCARGLGLECDAYGHTMREAKVFMIFKCGMNRQTSKRQSCSSREALAAYSGAQRNCSRNQILRANVRLYRNRAGRNGLGFSP